MLKYINNLANYKDPNSLGNKFRENRFLIFKKYIEKQKKPIRILDVGGTELFWVNRGFQNNMDYQITILNLFKEETNYPNLIGTKGNACDLSEFKDNEFDVVFSNSVIEHLYTKKNQALMAKEVKRVGRRYFIQTPNKYFFIEPHFFLPFFQFFPQKIKLFILTKTSLSRGKKLSFEIAKNRTEELRLLSLPELTELFPNSNIYKEKIFGMIKSFVVYNFN